MTNTDQDPIIINTSCGGTFTLRPCEMDNHQINGLIKQNPGHPAIEILEAELARRAAIIAARTA